MKNILIYCRESRDDGFINYERIETQRDILIRYCHEKNLGSIIDIIMDDNKSGTDFERLNPIKERVENNEVDILLMKDASRLGRNILESLAFTAFLDKYKVELIFESERYDEDMFPLIAWFNERRAKDDSTKIRRVLRHKMETGEMIIKAPYGYIKNGNGLELDGQTAAVVREIFGLYLDGLSKREIAESLNRKKYPTPSQLKEQYKDTRRAAVWNSQHIERILRHVIYTGDMPYGMRKKTSFKSKKYENVPKEAWIIVPNHHEPIISKEIFEAAQLITQKNQMRGIRSTSKNLFSELLTCGGCGSHFYRKARSGKSPWYFCSGVNRGCGSHRIRESILIETVRDYIEAFISAPENREHVLMAVSKQGGARDEVMRELQVVGSKIERLKMKASKIYDDRLEGMLPEYLLNEKLYETQTELDKLFSERERLNQSLDELQNTGTCNDAVNGLVKLTRSKEINNRILRLLFKKIIIFAPGEITPSYREQFDISEEQYNYLSINGGMLFVIKA